MPTAEEKARDLSQARFHDTVYSLNTFWRFTDGAWQPIPIQTVRAELIVMIERLGHYPSSRMLNSLIEDLSLRFSRPARDWNQDLNLIPCHNGLLDLTTLQVIPHEAGRHLLRSLPVAYDPAAQAPAWQSFLNSTVPHAADFLQEFAGLALTFDVRHETALWLYGPPGSGKSTFLLGLQAMLRDRSGQLDLLGLARRRLPIADFFGRSLLLSAEQPLRDLEHDNLLNALISGEPFAVEAPSREPDLLTVRAKWIWALVSLPRLTRSTSGLYRRVRVVPFPSRAEANRDPAIKDRISNEGPGILNWALAGLARLNQRGRLAPPPVVVAASDRFAEANDLFAQFVADCCLVDPANQEKSADLYHAYSAWCHASGLRPASTNVTATELERLGFERRRLHGTSVWHGLKLVPIRSNRKQSEFEETPDSDAPLATAATRSINDRLTPP